MAVITIFEAEAISCTLVPSALAPRLCSSVMTKSRSLGIEWIFVRMSHVIHVLHVCENKDYVGIISAEKALRLTTHISRGNMRHAPINNLIFRRQYTTLHHHN